MGASHRSWHRHLLGASVVVAAAAGCSPNAPPESPPQPPPTAAADTSAPPALRLLRGLERHAAWLELDDGDGVLLSTGQRVKQTASGFEVAAEHLGGGFAFASGEVLLRAETCSRPLTAKCRLPRPAEDLQFGLTDLMVRLSDGSRLRLS